MVLSFLQPYRKTVRNLDAAASLHGFDWRDPPLDEKRELLADLAAIAAGCRDDADALHPAASAGRAGRVRRPLHRHEAPERHSGNGMSPDGARATAPAATAPKAATSAITTPAPRAAPIATRSTRASWRNGG